jgi:hypothetical protein
MQPICLRKNKLMSLFIAQGDHFLLDAHTLVRARRLLGLTSWPSRIASFVASNSFFRISPSNLPGYWLRHHAFSRTDSPCRTL